MRESACRCEVGSRGVEWFLQCKVEPCPDTSEHESTTRVQPRLQWLIQGLIGELWEGLDAQGQDMGCKEVWVQLYRHNSNGMRISSRITSNTSPVVDEENSV